MRALHAVRRMKPHNIMKKRDNTARLIAIVGFYSVMVLIFIVRLLYYQVSGQDYYTMSTPAKTYSRYVTVKAQRGEIFDRNGIPLVSNDYTYDITLDYSSLPVDEEETNNIIIAVVDAARLSGESDSVTVPKEAIICEATDDGIDYSLSAGFLETVRGKRYLKLLDELNVDRDADFDAQIEKLLVYFGIASYNDDDALEYNYTYEASAVLFELRLDMYLSGFSPVESYTVAHDVSLGVMTSVTEKFSRGIIIEVTAARVYNYPGYASHILGKTGKVPDTKIEYYTERGYAYNAIVGIDGVEYAFEEYLRGIDGQMKITEDGYGNIISTEITKEPSPGHDVYLTIDINMQMVAEEALAKNVIKIRTEGLASGKPKSGEDAKAGAITAIDSDTGEVLAIGSYPTYNLATYGEDIATLINDPTSPLLNRALQGTYAPGSTFKVGVAVAALEEGIITKDTYINAQGIYMYYADSGFTPRCWLYLLTGQSHGPINVVEAIQESCNYFFYDVGRQLTIEKMNDYSRHYGLGEKTGIELYEQTGILAGPRYREENGLGQWSPGDTIQAAIGQSDNLFTPLQISSYIATVLNGGKRYNIHLLYQVREFGTGKVIYRNKPKVVDRIDISDETLELVREGMRGVMDNGSAASLFSGYAIPVGGKTGTAQVSDSKSENGIMTAFAPFDDPEIVVTTVIEQGSGGTEVGYSIRDLFDYYFDVGSLVSENNSDAAAEDAP